MADPTFVFTVDNKAYKVDLNDFTGTDARRFRQAVGMSLASALSKVGTGELDPLEFVAGFKWLKDLDSDPSLTFEAVLASLTYESVDLDPDAEVEDDEEDPPTHGGDSESTSPPSPTISDSNPGTSTTSPSVSSVST